MVAIDHLEADDFSPIGERPIVWIDLGAPDADKHAAALKHATMAIVGGIDGAGALPDSDPGLYDVLLTALPAPPAPWIGTRNLDCMVRTIDSAVRKAPVAACVLARVLRIGERLAFADALQIESLAYSTLLGGDAFRGWRAAQPMRTMPAGEGPFVQMTREGDVLTITLARPGARNGMCAGMRDALHAALGVALDDPSMPQVVLRGEGACFSTGGVPAEFGTATDLAQAHAIRTQRSCAALLHDLGDRATVILHGACIGSGIEIPAAAAHRMALPGAFFQLPELSMGLIPGAGGTVSLSRAIGRHRTCAMALSGRRVSRTVAATWGLVTPVAA